MENVITNWTVQGYYPNAPLFGFTEEKGISQFPATEEYEVNGTESLYSVLERNGIIENPMLDANTYRCEWVANRWWIYRTNIEIDGKSPRICFNGLDGVCRIYFNNRFLARHANSFVPLEIDMTSFAGQKGRLTVMVENQTENLNQSGYTSQITAQRPRYDSKWDFCPRLISLGIVASVTLKTGAEICDVKIDAKRDGSVAVSYKGIFLEEKDVVRFEVGGKDAESNREEDCFKIKIENPVLWSCNGRGEPSLYKGTLCILRDGDVVWQKSYNVGFRTVEFVRNENSPEDSLPYTIVLNGEKTYIKGVNFVPVDMSRAQFTKERYAALIASAKNMNVNLIRVWGGGVIETEDFYDLCDENGIMVWQDFTQSSSGIDNCATVEKDGIRNIARTAEYAVKRLRNHPSLVVYCGGNELMDKWVPLDYSHPNIAMLKGIVDSEDGTRTMLPTTASGGLPNGDVLSVGKGLHHDIHGPWTFMGNEEHYRYYNEMDSLLHSEFGADGFCNISAIEKMFSEEQRILSEISDNYVWRHKAEWWDPMPLCEEIFGKSRDLKEQIPLSQYVQAEALRYAAEANRRRAFNNSGSIVWQFNEPYPNLCCTNVVDYFGEPKPVYYALKRAFAAVNPNMKYSKMYYNPGETFEGELYITSEERGDFVLNVCVEKKGGTEEASYRATVLGKGRSVKVGIIKFIVPDEGNMLFKLVAEKNGRKYENEVLLLIKSGKHCEKSGAISFVKKMESYK